MTEKETQIRMEVLTERSQIVQEILNVAIETNNLNSVIDFCHRAIIGGSREFQELLKVPAERTDCNECNG